MAPQRSAAQRSAAQRSATERSATQRSATQRSATQRTAAERTEGAWASGTVGLPRMPFVLLVLALLGGGLICLLVINTTLGATSFRITQLQSTKASLSERDQALQQAIADSEAPSQIAHRAYALGMRWQSQLSYLDLANGRIYRLGARGPGTVLPLVPTSQARSERASTGNPASKTGGAAKVGASGAGGAGKPNSGLRHGGIRRPRPKVTARSAT